MYIPRHFQVDDEAEVMGFIESHAFAQLVSVHDGGLFATHLPLMLDRERRSLTGHLARANPQWQDVAGQQVLVIFYGPHAYVSPSWYESPGVPTWNYQAAHVYGTVEVFEEAARLAKLVNALAVENESPFDKPWTPDYREAMLGAIVGLEIAIERVECKYKLSQNRPAADRRNVISQLRETGANDAAEAMARLDGDSGKGEAQ